MAVVSESQFYMWRTVFAMAHADNIVTDEEIRFMAEALVDGGFSPEQRKVLEQDIKEPQDVFKMFGGISDAKDRSKFFMFARSMVYADGNYGPDEQNLMLQLKEIHMRDVNVDELIGTVELKFEDDAPPKRAAKPEERDVRGILSAFKKLLKQR
jgi:hypothetical protein